MNKQQFLAGALFNYTGKFRRIAHKGFVYDPASQKETEQLKIWKYMPSRQQICEQPANDWWEVVGDPSEDKFCVYQRNFGNIVILFKECQLVAEGIAI